MANKTKIGKEDLIIADGQYYSMDCYKTQINNNVLVVGTAGSGKTRSIVSPNILQATGSYIVTDPKGQLHKKYGGYLKAKGYEVKVLDFINPAESEHYNPLAYIGEPRDIQKLAHMIMDGSLLYEGQKKQDPFWEEAAELLLTALIGYLVEARPEHEQVFKSIFKLADACQVKEGDADSATTLDRLFDEQALRNPGSYAVEQYRKFRIGAGRTLRSILITLNTRLGRFSGPHMDEMLSCDTLQLEMVGHKKTAIFVIISDKDRTMDGLANIFYSQAMEELCREADNFCEDGRLPIPVRFILDDFATNCKITDFPRMISSIRSRGISTMLCIQAESQLEHCYGVDGRTIIGNSDTYVYLGGNDLETAGAIATRCDVPITKILYMPVGTNYIFRRGEFPVNGTNFDLEPFERQCLSKAEPAAR